MNFSKLGPWTVIFLAVAWLGTLEIEAKKSESYYDILGLKSSATDRQIKKAFRKLAVKYHPDKNKEPGAVDKFRKIAEAYEVLSDPDKKRQYDQFGESAFQQGGSGGHGGAYAFNFDEFMKQFNDQFGQGFGFHQGHASGGHPTYFGFGDLNDDNLFRTFDFGAGDSMFGNLHRASHASAHARAQSGHHGGFSGQAYSFGGATGGRSCKTVTQRVGNTVTTYTQCS